MIQHCLSVQVGTKVLGYGSGGTVVLEGELEGRPVAIKRLLVRRDLNDMT